MYKIYYIMHSYFINNNNCMTENTTDEILDETKVTDLAVSETAEVELVFAKAEDFRSIGERITSPLDSIISETARVIDKDPIMNVSDELSKMNNEVQEVYSEIISNDNALMKLMKSIPGISIIANMLDQKFGEASFNMKTIEGKLGAIFDWFDTSYNSINTSIELQKNFLDGIDANLGKIIAYKDFIGTKITEFKLKIEWTTDENEKTKMELFLKNVEFFQGNLVVLIGNLEMAKKRLLMRLDSANKLSLSMNSSRPIFKTLLSTAIIETSSQKAIDASMKAMDVMGKTIDKMSSELTDKAIEWNKKAEEMSSKPVVSTEVFIANVEKLKIHFDEIEEFREQIAIEAKEERRLFEEASSKLEDMKLLSKEDTEEFNKNLIEESVAELDKAKEVVEEKLVDAIEAVEKKTK